MLPVEPLGGAGLRCIYTDLVKVRTEIQTKKANTTALGRFGGDQAMVGRMQGSKSSGASASSNALANDAHREDTQVIVLTIVGIFTTYSLVFNSCRAY